MVPVTADVSSQLLPDIQCASGKGLDRRRSVRANPFEIEPTPLPSEISEELRRSLSSGGTMPPLVPVAITR